MFSTILTLQINGTLKFYSESLSTTNILFDWHMSLTLGVRCQEMAPAEGVDVGQGFPGELCNSTLKQPSFSHSSYESTL